MHLSARHWSLAQSGANHQGLTRAAYTATIFLGALLLFAVQPMITKMVLPRLGGSPSVWAVSICFFQAALLIGYLYAFVLNRLPTVLAAVLVHVAVLAAACIALPVALPSSAIAAFEGALYLGLVVLLAGAVGLPFVALAATAPLLQAWFARSDDPQAHDPYFLYRASNAGSLAALLAYPVLIEPLLSLSGQSATWSVGFVLQAVMIAGCGALILTKHSSAAPLQLSRANEGGRELSAAPVDWKQRLAWVGLSAMPSGLLVAFTTFLTMDVGSAPFLWVVPLAFYLATFIVVFRPTLPGERWLEAAQPILVGIALVSQSELGRVSLPLDATIGLIAFVVSCLVCHRRLYLRRPAAANLTEFYLWVSFGGVVGGMFSAILAPQIFSSPSEYPLLLALSLVWRARSLIAPIGRLEAAAILLSLVAALILGRGLAIGWFGMADDWSNLTRSMLLLTIAATTLAAIRLPRLQSALVVLTALLVAVALNHRFLYSERSFFGVHRVAELGDYRLLLHGTTLHGAQLMRTWEGRPRSTNVPPPAVSYFHPTSTHVLGLKLARAALPKGKPSASVGVIGLGAGAMACHASPGEAWRFFEIDHLVVEIAKNTRLFNYLSNCAQGSEIVMGDARITMAGQPDGFFDYLLFDAFTSDAVPVHLLTVEAIRLYLEKLSDTGVIALHISNRHLDLVSVVAANVEAVPGLSALKVNNPGLYNLAALDTVVVLIARRPEVLASAATLARGADHPIDIVPLAPLGVSPWTDDFSNVASALIRGYRNSFISKADKDIDYFSAVIAKFPGVEISHKRRAEAHFSKADYKAAIEDATTLMGLVQYDLDALKLRARARQLSGNDLGAIEDLTAYLSKVPHDIAMLELRAVAYGNSGQRQKAIADFREVLFLNPGNNRARVLLERLGGAR
jgi:hypothetical protein